MTKSSRAIFRNNSDNQIAVSPINSSKGQWDGFRLAPGGIDSIINSYGGSGNYDIEFRLRVDKSGKDDDVIIGEFRVDNPWIGDEYASSLTESIWFGESIYPVKVNGKTFSTQYYKSGTKVLRKQPDPYRFYDGDIGIFGSADKKEMVEITRDESKDQYANRVTRYYSESSNAAFDGGLPFIKARNIGDGSGAKSWEFIVVDTL
jgi:hypothetical protein